MNITRDQIYFSITGCCINNLAAENATDAIWELLHPRATKHEKITRVKLSEIPINTNFRMIPLGRNLLKCQNLPINALSVPENGTDGLV